jgi:hypothetical protein
MTNQLIPTGSSLYSYSQILRELAPRSIELDAFFRFFLVPGKQCSCLLWRECTTEEKQQQSPTIRSCFRYDLLTCKTAAFPFSDHPYAWVCPFQPWIPCLIQSKSAGQPRLATACGQGLGSALHPRADSFRRLCIDLIASTESVETHHHCWHYRGCC